MTEGAPERPAKPLTEKQQAILEFISRSVEARGYPPSMREIGDASQHGPSRSRSH